MSLAYIETLLGNDLFITELNGLVMRAADWAPAFEAIEESFYNIEARWFSTEGQGSWPDLADTTLDRKAYIGGAGGILYRTGDLSISLTQKGGAGSIIEDGFSGPAPMLFMGTDIPYAIYHQDGTNHMPARPVISLSEDDVALWAGILQDYLASATISVPNVW